ncbi:hypothetical protein DJ568_03270 [Mucilaginibacter hurinus]|uniref:Uncharacterized protein n=1 Tax=Mucilaginibacter hurinus TaxID=2201324 RepID=A0A367GQQ5_9SPHI|nr:hypothetical protein [Mucilaginibacter hurinus]RCH55789.1 hypothetical protein DJ568_03270 [Mucilaginibacter hurinus]
MNESMSSSSIMYATQYWGAPAFVKITPAGNSYDLYINDQHLAVLSYRDNLILEDVEGRFDDAEMISEITQHIEANVH